MNSNNQKAVVSPYNSQKAACFLLIGFPTVRELRQPLSRKEAVFMLCEWCNKQLTKKQIQNNNRFCGKSCSGSWTASKRYTLSVEERFWAKVDKSGDCWVWIAGVDKDGYGVFNDGIRKNVKTHRFIYELNFGKIPKGRFICHHCDNPSCVNPKHIYLGTAKSNARDMVKRNRHRDQYGTKNHMAIMNWEKVRKVRRMWASGEYTQTEIVKHFNVSRGCILGIIYNINWRE